MIMSQEQLKLTYNITSWSTWGLNYAGIPKCGNTMMKYYLLGQPELPEGADATNAHIHDPAKAYYIDPATANSNGCKNFTIIRNPADRVFSMWRDFYWKRRGFLGISERPTFEQFVEEKIIPSDDTTKTNVHFRSQFSFIGELTDLMVIALPAINDCQFLKDKFGVDFFTPLNTTINPDAKTVNSIVKDRILTRYKEDMALYYKTFSQNAGIIYNY